MNAEEAADVAEEFLKGKSLEELFDVVIVPALALAEEDCRAGRLEDDQQEFIFHNARLLVEDMALRADDIIAGATNSKHRENGEVAMEENISGTEARVLSLPARSEADEIAAFMLAQLLNAHGIRAKVISASALASERLEEAGGAKIEVVCVSTVRSEGRLHTRYLCKRIRGQFPEMRIVAAVLARQDGEEIRKRELSSAVNEVALSLSEAVNQIRALISVPPTPAVQTAFSS
jgi:hypothetical protein